MKKTKKPTGVWFLLISTAVLCFLAGFYFSRILVKVPPLTGLSLAEAEQLLKARKLSPLVKSPGGEAGDLKVRAQYPPAGKLWEKNQAVRLYLAPAGELQLPDLRESKQAEALAVLSDFGIAAKIELKPSAWEKGQVIDQDPPAGAILKAEDKVVLTVSLGAMGLKAPDLIGKSLSEAGEIIAPLGLKLTAEGEGSLGEKDAQITRQQPQAGEMMVGKELRVFWEKTLVVPELRGKSLEEAKRILADCGLKIGKIHYQTLPDTPAGKILEQEPPGGMEISSDQEVELNVSGPQKE